MNRQGIPEVQKYVYICIVLGTPTVCKGSADLPVPKLSKSMTKSKLPNNDQSIIGVVDVSTPH